MENYRYEEVGEAFRGGGEEEGGGRNNTYNAGPSISDQTSNSSWHSSLRDDFGRDGSH